MPVLSLDAEEADVVLLGLCLATRSVDPVASAAAERVIQRLDALLPAAPPPRGVLPSGASARIAAPVATALEARRKLRLTYLDREGCRTDRIVWPVGIVDGAAGDLLVAWCELREAFRHFRAVRIARAEMLSELHDASRRVLLARYMAEVVGGDR